jgi:hypothetical protein
MALLSKEKSKFDVIDLRLCGAVTLFLIVISLSACGGEKVTQYSEWSEWQVYKYTDDDKDKIDWNSTDTYQIQDLGTQNVQIGTKTCTSVIKTLPMKEFSTKEYILPIVLPEIEERYVVDYPDYIVYEIVSDWEETDETVTVSDGNGPISTIDAEWRLESHSIVDDHQEMIFRKYTRTVLDVSNRVGRGIKYDVPLCAVIPVYKTIKDETPVYGDVNFYRVRTRSIITNEKESSVKNESTEEQTTTEEVTSSEEVENTEPVDEQNVVEKESENVLSRGDENYARDDYEIDLTLRNNENLSLRQSLVQHLEAEEIDLDVIKSEINELMKLKDTLTIDYMFLTYTGYTWDEFQSIKNCNLNDVYFSLNYLFDWNRVGSGSGRYIPEDKETIGYQFTGWKVDYSDGHTDFSYDIYRINYAHYLDLLQ